jgi:UPF0716 protein FxsA
VRWLLLLFILVPAIEVTILANIVGWIGGLNTLVMIVLTGIAGAALAKRAGLGVLKQIHTELAYGRMPTGALVDGAIILVAGVLLVTPGVLTDLLGFLLLIPALRSVVKRLLKARFERAIRSGQIIDVTPRPIGRKDQLR